MEILDEVRALLRAEVAPERMLRSIATLLAQHFDYCVADMADSRGEARRVEIAHADPCQREWLRVLADETSHAPHGRIATLLARGGTEHLARVTQATRARCLADLTLLDARIASLASVTISVGGAPFAVLTLIATSPKRELGADEVRFLKGFAEWTSLGLENALRRQLQPRTSVIPPAAPCVEEVRSIVAHR